MVSRVKIGILGGGQLGRMLLQEAADWDLNCAVLDPDENAPAKHLCHEFVQGSFQDYETVLNFGRNKDILTIEIENVNVEALFQLESEGVKVYPQPAVIAIIQDKALQKEFLIEHDLPTAPYVLLEDAVEAIKYPDYCPGFIKLRKGGYDGKGVQSLKSVDSPVFLSGQAFIEKAADLDKEISVMIARSERGEMAVYPVVEMLFHPEANMLDMLICPADISSDVEEKIQCLAGRIAIDIDIIGILAIEMFLLKDGTVWINEMAPRPHNSGHHTIEANETSQFGQLLRAILGLPLGSANLISPAAMANVLGSKGFEGNKKIKGLDFLLQERNIYWHDYGKVMTKPLRKMGHITALDTTSSKAMAKVRNILPHIKIIS